MLIALLWSGFAHAANYRITGLKATEMENAWDLKISPGSARLDCQSFIHNFTLNGAMAYLDEEECWHWYSIFRTARTYAPVCLSQDGDAILRVDCP